MGNWRSRYCSCMALSPRQCQSTVGKDVGGRETVESRTSPTNDGQPKSENARSLTRSGAVVEFRMSDHATGEVEIEGQRGRLGMNTGSICR